MATSCDLEEGSSLDLAGVPDLLRGAPALILGLLLMVLAVEERAGFLAGGYLFFGGFQVLAIWIPIQFPGFPSLLPLYMLGEAMKLIPLAFGLVLVATFPRPLRWIERRMWLVLIPFAVALAYMAAFTLWRGFVTVDHASGVLTWTQNERWIGALVATAEVTIFVGILLRLRRAPPGPAREAIALIALGLVSFRVIYGATVGLSLVLGPAAGHPFPVWRFQFANVFANVPWGVIWSADLLFVPLSIATLALGLSLSDRGPIERAFVAVVTTCLILGALQAMQDAFLGRVFMIWSIGDGVGPIILLVGVLRATALPSARHRAILAAGAIVLLAVLYITTASATLGLLGESSTASFAAQSLAMAAVAAVAIPVWRLGTRAAGPLEDASHARKLAVYRAALEDVMEASPDESATRTSGLSRLRAELGISERDHAVIVHVLREASTTRSSAFLAPGKEFLGRYAVERSLGRGGFGETWLAKDQRLGRRVAIKALHSATGSASSSLMVREMRALAAVRHPHVIALHDIQEIGSSVYLIMEYAEGGSIRQALARDGPFATKEVRKHAEGLLAALEAVHARGLVHRDLKPSNVLLRDGDAVLADFGSAARVAAEDVSVTVSGLATASGPGAGTLFYAAPEQVRGLAGDARSDLYSLCATLAEMASGRPYLAFAGLSDFEARQAILARAPDLTGVPDPALRVWLEKGLAKDPEDRWPDAASARRALADEFRNRAAADR